MTAACAVLGRLGSRPDLCDPIDHAHQAHLFSDQEYCGVVPCPPPETFPPPRDQPSMSPAASVLRWIPYHCVTTEAQLRK